MAISETAMRYISICQIPEMCKRNLKYFKEDEVLKLFNYATFFQPEHFLGIRFAEKQKNLHNHMNYGGLYREGGGNRTHDQRIKSPLLYQLSYTFGLCKA